MNHPIHPFIVHFPIACWSLATLGDLVGLVAKNPQVEAIGILMFIGCITGLVAMVAGLYEIGKIHNISSILTIVNQHMYAAITTCCFYSVSLFLRWDNNFSEAPSTWAIACSFIGFLSLMLTGWRGASLVYQYGVGSNKVT